MDFRWFSTSWNRLALIFGKRKLLTKDETEKFLRDLAKNSPGPNDKMIQMRREYESVKKAQSSANSDRSCAVGASAVQH